MENMKIKDCPLGDFFTISISKFNQDNSSHFSPSLKIKESEKIEMEVEFPNENYFKFREELIQLVLKYINPLEYKISQESIMSFDEVCEIVINLKTLGMTEEQIEVIYDNYGSKALKMAKDLLRCSHSADDIMMFMKEN